MAARGEFIHYIHTCSSLSGSCDRFRLLYLHLWHYIIFQVTKSPVAQKQIEIKKKSNVLQIRQVGISLADSEAAQLITWHSQNHQTAQMDVGSTLDLTFSLCVSFPQLSSYSVTSESKNKTGSRNVSKGDSSAWLLKPLSSHICLPSSTSSSASPIGPGKRQVVSGRQQSSQAYTSMLSDTPIHTSSIIRPESPQLHIQSYVTHNNVHTLTQYTHTHAQTITCYKLLHPKHLSPDTVSQYVMVQHTGQTLLRKHTELYPSL